MQTQLQQKLLKAKLRRQRVRAKISGTAERPRLSVFVSNRHIVAQLIDDTTGKTLGAVTTVKAKGLEGKTMTQKAEWVGEQIGVVAKKAKLSTVVFDRGYKLYHGRIAALAAAARKQGIQF